GHDPPHQRLHGQLADEQERSRSPQLAGYGQPLRREHVHRPRDARHVDRRSVLRGDGEAPRSAASHERRRADRLPAVHGRAGADNGFSVRGDRGAGAPGLKADEGQPTHFLPRRNRFVFKVRVPATFTVKDELVWTLTSHGKTEKAYATLRPDYVLDDVVKASE